MNRLPRNLMFMEIAEIVAKRSTCLRANVGAILVNPHNNNIVSIGYNGVPSGYTHCVQCIGKGCEIALHAEANAINRLPHIDKLFPDKLDLYTTVSPCEKCTRKIIESQQIDKIFFRDYYRETKHLRWLTENGITIYRILQNGEIICNLDFT